MADQRATVDVVLSDATTKSQQAAVDASGRVSVNLTASSATVTVDTELPAAAALTDNFANPTAPGVGAFLMGFDGTNWDRVRADSGSVWVQGAVAQDSPIGTQFPLPAGGRASSAVPTAMSADGDVVHRWLDRSGGTIVNGRDAHDAAIDANTYPQLVGGRASAAAPTDVTADGDAVRAWFLRNGAQAAVITAAGALIGGDATNGLDVDVTRVTGTVTVDSELPTASQISADDVTAPTAPAVYSYLMGYDNTDGNWDRVRVGNDTGRLQVDVISGGGSDTPTSPVNSYDTTAAVAAGSTDNHDTADLGGTTRKVAKVIFGASVALKVELVPVSNGTPGTTLAVGFSPAGGMGEIVPSHRDYFSTVFSANAGFDGFRLVRTNLDVSEAADVYSTIQYEA